MKMVSFTKILWPTDFSDISLQAVDYLILLAERFSSTLHIITIIPPLTDFVGLGSHFTLNVQKMIDAIRKESQQKLEKLVKENIPASITTVTQVLDDVHPWEGIITYSNEQDIDLIVINTHGSTGIKHALFGGTTDKVIRKANCPVLTIKSISSTPIDSEI